MQAHLLPALLTLVKSGAIYSSAIAISIVFYALGNNAQQIMIDLVSEYPDVCPGLFAYNGSIYR